jgi:type I restriction enzyme S subunit
VRTQTVSLGDLCNPKQYPTLSSSNLTENGFVVYGANGPIGHYSEFTHIKPTILIGCRGSCGTVHLTEPKCYANGNAMALDALDLSRVNIQYLKFWLEFRGFADVTTGSSQPQITRGNITRVEVPLFPLDEQRRIAAILDQADDLRRKRREALGRLQRLVPSIFLEMFGDSWENRRKWPVACLGDAGKLDRGVSRHRPRNDPILLGGLHPLIQTGDIANCDGYIRNFSSTYSDEGLRQSKKWPAGTLCITIAANIGKTGILSFDACFPDSVVGFTPGKQVKTEFIQELLRFLQPELEKDAPQFAQKNINLETLRSLSLFIPPLALQEEFAARVAKIDKLKAHHRAHLARLDALFASLQHRAFRGDLPASSFSRLREKVASRSEVG